jgi:hypothetical protein
MWKQWAVLLRFICNHAANRPQIGYKQAYIPTSDIAYV